MTLTPLTLPTLTLPTLTNTPSTIRAMLAGLPDATLEAIPAHEANAGDWSIRTVVAHLIDGHRRQAGRIRRMIEEDRPTLANIDEWESMLASGLLNQPTTTLVELFTTERARDIPWYASLDATALARIGLHSLAGEVTVANILNHAAYHDAQHLGQIARLIEVAAHTGRGNMRLVDT